MLNDLKGFIKNRVWRSIY